MDLTQHPTKFCFTCGTKIHERAEICPACGVRQPDVSQSIKLGDRDHKSRIAAVFLALLLGGIGAHKFYLNQSGQGLVYLLLCWTLIPAVCGLIEGVWYMLMPDREFDRRFNQRSH